MYYIRYLKTGKEENLSYKDIIYRFPKNINIELMQTGMVTQIIINSTIYGKVLIREI